ncbi:Lipase 5 [Teratosphaeriaceae sp. CCFEE 6253]|nr:Lipase 5 [Teratosphaeriaceae sp. CCFEE 6253]
MDLLTVTRWSGTRRRCDGEDDAARPRKRHRTSKSVAILQAGTQLVRSPLDTIACIADSLGYTIDNVTPLLSISTEAQRKQICLARMQSAETYDDWRTAALDLDAVEGGAGWKAQDASDDYDYDLVRTALTRDLGGMGDVKLYTHSRVGTKTLIEHYIDTVVDTIDRVVDEAGGSIGHGRDARSVWDQMKLSRQSFGRSALLLSGGGTLGMNHIGVVKALFEGGLLPRIISGASAGSIVCAVLCTKTDPDIPDVLHEFCNGDLDVFESEGESVVRKITRFFTQGAIYEISNLKRVMEDLIGTMTFQEAYNRTQRILNICVSSAGLYEMPRLLNYVTAPDVMIASAVAASCSVPSVFSAADLMAKDPRTGKIKHFDDSPSKWIDGSVDNDLPMARLAEMFNVNHFIVSQVNPHVVPFLAREEDESEPAILDSPAVAPGSGWFNGLANLAKGEALHRIHLLAELGVFPNVMTKVRSVVGQRYAGDITIIPEISYAQFPNILRNPTQQFMVQALRNGERATWPKLSRIRNHLAVEMKLDWAVRKMLDRVAFSQSQVELRMNVFSRPIKRGLSARGRSRRHSRASNKSASAILPTRRLFDLQRAQDSRESIVEPPLTLLVDTTKVTGVEVDEYISSSDEARSPRSTSPDAVGDDFDSSDVASNTSVSSPSPRLDPWPATRNTSQSAVQLTTANVMPKRYMSTSPASSRGPALTTLPTDLTMTPSPTLKYKNPFRSALSPMPTIRSQAGTPETQEEEEVEEKRPGPFRQRGSRLAMNLAISGASGIMQKKQRRLSTGLPGLRPPDKR